MGQNIRESAREVVSQQSKNLSKQPASKIKLLAALLIVVCAAVLTAHWPALSAQARGIDDNLYITKNLLVQKPGWASAWRFLTEVLEPSGVRAYYHPITMISLMIDYALGGRADNLMPFHRTSLILHAANTALVIVLLYLLFGRIWVAAGVGLLFGLHPMTVETIPWVSERKTLLAAFFALWCLIFYIRFTRKGSWRLYLGSLAMYILAVMSKPTSLPLPLLMLLADFWPLKRWKWQVVTEKLRFFVVMGLFAIITYISQSRTAGVKLPAEYGPERIPLTLCHNIIFYPYKMVWPVNLTSTYAFPKSLGLSNPMVLAGVIGTCILILLLVVSLRWTRAVLIGWLIFFVAVLPTMQIVGFSDVIAADKFAYLPSIGLLMLLTLFLGWICGTNGVGRLTVRRVAVVIIVLVLASAEAVATRRYLVHWRDTLSLYKHMLTVTPNAALAHNNYANALLEEGQLYLAISHYRKALQVKPNDAVAHYNMGNALRARGKLDEAISHFRKALQVEPNFTDAHNNLGSVLAMQGKFDEAVSHFRHVLRIEPNLVPAHYNLAKVLASQGNLDEAIKHLDEALRIKPDSVRVRNLRETLLQQSKLK
jgi:Flp pilus assembly protein TadD